MNPYGIAARSDDNARDIGLLLAAAEVIDGYCQQPLHRRHATMRFDLYDGRGFTPQPLHTATAVRLQGKALEAGEYGINRSVFELAGTRQPSRNTNWNLVEVDGVMGFGTLSSLTGYSSAGALLIPPEGGAGLPLGTVLYNAGLPVHVAAVDDTGMHMSGDITDTRSYQIIVMPPSLQRASDIIVHALARLSSGAAVEDDDKNELLTDEVRQLLAPFVAELGGVASYGTLAGTPGFPQDGRAFGPGFGRGFG